MRHLLKIRYGMKHGHKPSSTKIHSPGLVFSHIILKEGDAFLDLGCGTGEYTVFASRLVGVTGTVIAIDQRDELLENIMKNNIYHNITAIKEDIANEIPVNDRSIDCCLISTVLHCVDMKKHGYSIFKKLRKKIKPGGVLAVIECKKETTEFGPPLEHRLAPNEIKRYAECFEETGYHELNGNYMLLLS